MTEYLANKGVPFEEIDIRGTPGAIEELIKMGVMATPAMVAGRIILIGFNPEKIDRAVEEMQMDWVSHNS